MTLDSIDDECEREIKAEEEKILLRMKNVKKENLRGAIDKYIQVSGAGEEEAFAYLIKKLQSKNMESTSASLKAKYEEKRKRLNAEIEQKQNEWNLLCQQLNYE